MNTSTITRTHTTHTTFTATLGTTTQPTHSPQPCTRSEESDPFFERFGQQLPRGLREEAQGMSWQEFIGTYGRIDTHHIRHLSQEKIGLGTFRFEADIDGTHREIVATGPINACTNLLSDMGRRIEILNFHQYRVFEGTVTFIRATNNRETCWAVGFGPSQELSAASVMSAASCRLYG